MSYWRLFYHLIWSTLHREPIITPLYAKTIEESLRLTANDHDAIPHAVGIMPDHEHFAVSVPPKISISDFVQELKGGSSRTINKTLVQASEARFRWQGEYAVLSISEDRLPRVIAYVKNQERHHAENKLSARLEYDGSLPQFHDRKLSPG